MWFRLFIKIGAIFLVFVIVLFISNSAFLSKYYEYSKKKQLISVATRIKGADLESSNEMIELLSEIQGDFGFECEIYNRNGKTLYSSLGGQMMDWLFKGNDMLDMHHRPLNIIKEETLSDGSKMITAEDKVIKREYFIYKFSLNHSATGEVRIQRSLITDSANIANEFIIFVAVCVLLASLVWVFVTARKIAKPISEMNKITSQMSRLDFSKRLDKVSDDEIGQLAQSINVLSESLNLSLKSLKESNAKLKDEIELERSLDKMRRGFVANVSHELKTPIAIIQGYAEGLRLDVQKESKDKYCDIIIDESKRMNKLVLSLLSLSRYESGQVEINKNPFDLSALIKGMGSRILEKTQKAQINYSFADGLIAFGDDFQIEQILKSYFENAISHVSEKGKIEARITEAENKYTVSVFNTGEQIDEKIMPEIWQSFYKDANSRGNGLGLSIVKTIMEVHNKKYGVKCEDGFAEFYIIL